MFPRRLTIKGLYSYQEEQTIDFQLLTEAGLFGIFGAVGSGKSSILEAIGFALYGKTERLNDKENRNYNMMNLKSNELVIDFEFENFDKTLYRFRVEGRRNGRHFESVNSFVRRAFKWENETWLPLATTDASAILDLSYDNFRRTIIIPQGKFQEFLQLGSKDRARMMMDIFHLQKYDLSFQVKKLEDDNNLSMENLKGKISSLSDNIPQNLEIKEEQLKNISELEISHNATLLKKEKAFDQISKIKDIAQRLELAQKEQTELLTKETSFKERSQILKEYKNAKMYFESDFLQRNDIQKRLESRQSSINVQREKLQVIIQKITTLNEQKKANQPFVDDLETANKRVTEYGWLIDIAHLEQQELQLSEKIGQTDEQIERQQTEKVQKEQSLSLITRSIMTKKSLQPDNIFIFNDIEKWFADYNNTLKQLNDKTPEIAKFEKRIQDGKAIFSTLSFSFDNWQKEASAQKKSYSERQKELQEQKNQLSIQMELHQYANTLQDGLPCPLCGSIHHPQVMADNGALSEKLQKIVSLLLKNEENLNLLQANISKATKYATGIEGLDEQKKKLVQSVNEGQMELKEQIAQFRWEGFDYKNEVAFQEKKQAAKNSMQEILDLQNEAQLIQKEIDDISEQLHGNMTILTAQKTKAENIISNKNSISGKIEILKHLLTKKKSEQTLSQEKEKTVTQIAETHRKQEELQTQLSDYDKQKALTENSIQNNEVEIKTDNDSLAKVNEKIATQLSTMHLSSEIAITEILSKNISIEAEETAIQSYEKQLNAVNNKLLDYQKELNGQHFDQQEWADLKAQIATLKDEIKSYTERIAQLKLNISNLQKELSNQKKWLSELETKEIRRDNLNEFKNLFKGNGFVNYISSVYLRNLCQAANERFMKLTKNHLQLELTELNDFIVRDILNDGKTRSVKTLSGGQTFQASLSLALALADSVHTQQKSEQNFFFLDEGFGSLDKDALDTVFETLKSLRKENRIVGIISHVEELRQEIPISLLITNDTETGSHVQYSNL